MSNAVTPFAATRAWIGSAADKNGWTTPLSSVFGAAVASWLFADPNWWRCALGVLAILLGLCARGVRVVVEVQRREGERNAVADHHLLMKEALRPLAELTATLIGEGGDDSSKTFGKIMQHAVGAAILPFPNEDRVRAVIFVISTDLLLMEPEAHAGRDQKPGSFNRGDRRGDRAFAILEKRKPRVFVRDLDKEKPRTWAGSGVGYRTFITVPIGDQSGAYGLLTLDAPEPGVLTDSDVLLLELIAQMLSVVFASVSKISPSAGGSEGRPRGG